MALYDNKLWLLSHIRNSFISTDDTGMCELVMVGEDLPKNLAPKLDCFPLSEDSDDEDDIEHESYDIQWDMDFGVHRQRSNTAQRLEKMDIARRKAEKIKHIKWEAPKDMTTDEMEKYFVKKDLTKCAGDGSKKRSLLTESLTKCPVLPHNPYMEYAKFDGSAQVGIPIRKYKIFLTMLPEEQRNYPMHVCITATAKIKDLIGLILLKCSTIHGDFPLQPVNQYGLHMTEEDGEVERDFPCLEPNECVTRFGFNCLGLVENKHSAKSVSFETTHVLLEPSVEYTNKKPSFHLEEKQISDNLAIMKGHTTKMEAPLYQSFRVLIVNKVLAKSEINLGISGDKIEIDPVQQKNSKFWARQKAISYNMDSVAWCEITETYKSGRAVFQLVYSLSHGNGSNQEIPTSLTGKIQSSALQTSASFKHHEFEAEHSIAEEIVRKVNHILELRSSRSRKEFLESKEKKRHRRKSFHLVNVK